MIYLASPYTSPYEGLMDLRYEQVASFTVRLLLVGQPIYSPIVHCHYIAMNYNLPREFEFWQHYNRQMLDASAKLFVYCLDGWKESRGVTEEIIYANHLGLHIVYWHPDQKSWRVKEDAEWQE